MTYIITYRDWTYTCNAWNEEAARGSALSALHDHSDMATVVLSDLAVEPMPR